MEILSIYRGARISAFKAREVTREIQGLPVAAALDLITFSPKKAATMVGKTLKSAIANAENNNDLKADTLVVKEATVGEGQTMRRMKSRARGSSSVIRKRTSHIRIVLSDEIVIPQRKPKTAKSKSKGRPSAAGAKTPKASAPKRVATSTPAEPASQENAGPGETPSAPIQSSETDATQL